ncbi:unnamed protein product [Cuscuta campestris]|uniref:Uncharacterized protein n=1 Tax=Cuscuta campestris TaxID=132261 RepID=A0A484LI29_9ASTE|nr:unnamed protein product [Cuscuta campestris]
MMPCTNCLCMPEVGRRNLTCRVPRLIILKGSKVQLENPCYNVELLLDQLDTVAYFSFLKLLPQSFLTYECTDQLFNADVRIDDLEHVFASARNLDAVVFSQSLEVCNGLNNLGATRQQKYVVEVRWAVAQGEPLDGNNPPDAGAAMNLIYEDNDHRNVIVVPPSHPTPQRLHRVIAHPDLRCRLGI